MIEGDIQLCQKRIFADGVDGGISGKQGKGLIN